MRPRNGALSLRSNARVVKKRRWGMGCWVGSNLIWIPHHWMRGDWPSVMLFGAYLALALAVWGFLHWKKA